MKGNAKLVAYFPCRSYHSDCKEYKLSAEVSTLYVIQSLIRLYKIVIVFVNLFFLQIDGSHSFVISKEKITDLYPFRGSPYYGNYGYQIVLNASVTEKLTQKTYYGEATVKLYESAIALKYSESNPKAFKPGFPFQALVSCFGNCIM